MLTKIKQDNMPYKQPKNTPIHNKDGASAIPLLAAIPALIKGIAAAGKGVAVAAKAGKAAAATAKAAKAGKLAAKSAKLAKAGKAAKSAKLAAKSGKAMGKATTKMSKASEFAKKANKFTEMGKKATEGTTKLQQGIDKIGMKAENVARKGADKISKITGQDFSQTLDFVRDKGKTIAAGIGSAGIAKIKQATQKPETGSAEDFLPESSSYTNPMGPSAKVSQGTQTNQGIQRTNPPIFSSLSRSNLQRQDDTIGGKIVENLKNLDANINIGGIPVNIGDVISTGAGVARGADALVRHRKKLKEIERRVVNKKQSAYRAKEEEANKKMMQELKSVSDKKGL